MTNKSTGSLQIDLASVLTRYSAVDMREYQMACIRETIDNINKGADVLIDLPTGTGKTLIYAPIVAEVAACGRRTLVLTATKDSQRRVASEIGKFDAHLRPSIVYGIQEYECPLLKSYAQSWCCAEFKEDFCKPNKLGCKVISSETEYAQSNLVVTNFSKFILTSAESPYDLIVLDDSHSFKDAIIALEEHSREISWQIYHFIKRCQSSSKYQFYVRKDYYKTEDLDSGELISRMDDILDFVIRTRFNHSRVVYVTATPGDVRAHASSCTHREYETTKLSVAGPGFTSPEIQGWFDKLLILVTEDIGRTRQTNSFEKAPVHCSLASLFCVAFKRCLLFS